MIRTVLAAIALVCAAASAQAQSFSAEELARRTIERRAVEAVIWGMPAVNYDLMLQEMLTKTDGQGEPGRSTGVAPLDWHNQTLTPNPDAIYFMAFINTKDVGPIVLEVPPANGRLAQRQHRHRLADAARGCGPARRRQGQGRQVPDPSAGLHRPDSRGLHPASVRHVRRLRAAALEPREPQRCRRREGHRLWQAGQGLSAVAGRQSAGNGVHRRQGCPVRLHHPLRRELLRGARTASCRASPGCSATGR